MRQVACSMARLSNAKRWANRPAAVFFWFKKKNPTESWVESDGGLYFKLLVLFFFIFFLAFLSLEKVEMIFSYHINTFVERPSRGFVNREMGSVPKCILSDFLSRSKLLWKSSRSVEWSDARGKKNLDLGILGNLNVENGGMAIVKS